MNRVGIFLLSILLFTVAAFGLEAPPKGSVHYEKGFVIRSGGDTTQGFLYRDQDDALGKAVQFTADSTLQAKPIVYYPADLKGFFFAQDSALFEAVDYSYKKDTVEIREKRFAKLLVLGYATLYRLQLPPGEQHNVADNNNVCAYVIRMNNEDNVLRETEKTNGTDYTLVKKYIGTLKILFKDCPALPPAKLNDVRFNDAAMISIVRRYDACVRPNDNTLVPPHKSVLKFFHEPEVGFTFFKFNDWDEIYSLGYVLETVYPDLSDAISLDVGLKYNRLVQRGAKSINGFEIPIYLGFNFDNEDAGPFINYGANLHYFYIDSGFYSLILNSLRLGIKLHRFKIIGQFEALSIIDMVTIGRIKMYTICLGYGF
jgi:hypothetical protein